MDSLSNGCGYGCGVCSYSGSGISCHSGGGNATRRSCSSCCHNTEQHHLKQNKNSIYWVFLYIAAARRTEDMVDRQRRLLCSALYHLTGNSMRKEDCIRSHTYRIGAHSTAGTCFIEREAVYSRGGGRSSLPPNMQGHDSPKL